MRVEPLPGALNTLPPGAARAARRTSPKTQPSGSSLGQQGLVPGVEMDNVQAQSGGSTHLGGGERIGLPNESMAASRPQKPAGTCALPTCSCLRVRAEHES